MRITFPLLRDLVFLGLGSGGMARELFFIPQPDTFRVWIEIGLMLGPAFLASLWKLRNPGTPPTTPTAVGPSPSPSSSQSPGS